MSLAPVSIPGVWRIALSRPSEELTELLLPGLDLSACTMKDVFDKFGLETTTKDFIGHAMALYQDDSYINSPGAAPEAIERIRLYGNSVARYGKSPYIYPLYGLGELPQGFARLSAIYGGTYMLNTHVDEFLTEGGKTVGIKATMKGIEPEMKFETKATTILGDPSYFPGKVKITGHVLRAICILKHPLAHTNDSDSAQLIIPQSQVGRKNGWFPSPPPIHYCHLPFLPLASALDR